MKRAILAAVILCGTAAVAGDTYQLEPAQLHQLEGDQKQVTRAFLRFTAAQQDLEAAKAKLAGDAERIRQVNGWPDGTVFRQDTLNYSPGPAPRQAPATGSNQNSTGTPFVPTLPARTPNVDVNTSGSGNHVEVKQ